MLIRSQDGTELINFSNVVSVFAASKKVKVATTLEHCPVSIIGEYSTKEKALEVLDMIQEKYTHSLITINGEGTVTKSINVPRVFQMPKEN